LNQMGHCFQPNFSFWSAFDFLGFSHGLGIAWFLTFCRQPYQSWNASKDYRWNSQWNHFLIQNRRHPSVFIWHRPCIFAFVHLYALIRLLPLCSFTTPWINVYSKSLDSFHAYMKLVAFFQILDRYCGVV